MMKTKTSQRIEEILGEKRAKAFGKGEETIDALLKQLRTRKHSKARLSSNFLMGSSLVWEMAKVAKTIEQPELQMEASFMDPREEEEISMEKHLVSGIARETWKQVEPVFILDTPRQTPRSVDGESYDERKGMSKPPISGAVKKPNYARKPSDGGKPPISNKSTPKVGNTANNDKGFTGKNVPGRMIDIDVDHPLENPYLSTPKDITQLTPKEPGSRKSNASHKSILHDKNETRRPSIPRKPSGGAAGNKTGGIELEVDADLKAGKVSFGVKFSNEKEKEESESQSQSDKIQPKRRQSKMSSMSGKLLERMRTKKIGKDEGTEGDILEFPVEKIEEETHTEKERRRRSPEKRESNERNSLSPARSPEKQSISPMKMALEDNMPKSTRLQAMRLMEMENPSKYEIARMQKEGLEEYNDGYFPPKVASLLKNPKRAKENSVWKEFKWLRIWNGLFAETSISLCEDIQPTGMIPNNMSPFYFIGAISALAETPPRLARLFGTQVPCREGCYHVFMNIRGIWRAVVIDDFIPVIQDAPEEQPEIAFLNPDPAKTMKKVDVWFMLLEKAWAKIQGNYEAIENGSVCSFLRDLTGAPTYEFPLDQDEETVWDLLDECFKKNYVVIAEQREKNSETFTVVQTTEITTDSGEKLRLCRIRGGCSTFDKLKSEAVSDMATYSQLSENFKKYRGERDLWNFDEKTVICPISHLIKEFQNLTICLYNEGYEYLSVAVRQHRNAFSVVKFSLEEESQCYIETSQLDMKFYGEELAKKKFYEYSSVHIFILKEKDEGDFQIIDGAFQISQRNTYVPLELQPGTYYAVVAVNWRERIYDLVVNYYGSEKPLEFQRVSMSSMPNILNSGLFDYAINSGSKEGVSGSPTVNKYKCEIPQWGVECWAYVNQSNEKLEVIKEKLEIKDVKAVLGDPSSNGAPDIKDVEIKESLEFSIEPNGRRVLYFKKV